MKTKTDIQEFVVKSISKIVRSAENVKLTDTLGSLDVDTLGWGEIVVDLEDHFNLEVPEHISDRYDNMTVAEIAHFAYLFQNTVR